MGNNFRCSIILCQIKSRQYWDTWASSPTTKLFCICPESKPSLTTIICVVGYLFLIRLIEIRKFFNQTKRWGCRLLICLNILVKSFYSIKYGSSIITSNVRQIIQRVLNRWSKLSEQKLRFFSKVKI